jgi:hypothetical protein
MLAGLAIRVPGPPVWAQGWRSPPLARARCPGRGSQRVCSPAQPQDPAPGPRALPVPAPGRHARNPLQPGPGFRARSRAPALPRSRAPSMLTPTREPACISDGMGRAPRTHHARHPNPSHASRILAIPAGFQRMLPPFQDAIRPARQHASVPAYQHSTCWHASTVLQLPRHAATLPPCVHAQSRACLKNPSPWDSSVLPPS